MKGPNGLETEPLELTEQQQLALHDVPQGAITLAGTSVLLLLVAWVLIYLLVYLPRGMVG